jgi:hypothetical protein
MLLNARGWLETLANQKTGCPRCFRRCVTIIIITLLTFTQKAPDANDSVADFAESPSSYSASDTLFKVSDFRPEPSTEVEQVAQDYLAGKSA